MGSPFKILFDQEENPKDAESIKRKLSNFQKSYRKVTKTIIDNSCASNLDEKEFEKLFKKNVATLMPSFRMTRVGVFQGMRMKKGIPEDSKKKVLEVCWTQFGKEFLDLKEKISKNTSSYRSRAILDQPKDIFRVTSDLFDKLEWTEIEGSNVGRVGASKILFAIFPEIALPVDNSEWDNVFRTHDYGKILKLMTDEIRSWENKSNMMHLETLDSNSPTTLPAVYNVMAMDARPKPSRNSKRKMFKTWPASLSNSCGSHSERNARIQT